MVGFIVWVASLEIKPHNHCNIVVFSKVCSFAPRVASYSTNAHTFAFCTTGHHFWRGRPAKGQLISKCLFGIFNSPKKQTKNLNFTTVVPQGSSRIVFVHFLVELKTPKRHFDINWPLLIPWSTVHSFTLKRSENSKNLI